MGRLEEFNKIFLEESASELNLDGNDNFMVGLLWVRHSDKCKVNVNKIGCPSHHGGTDQDIERCGCGIGTGT